MSKTAKKAADYILPLYMNGLSGRMLRLPSPTGRKREILFISGHHTSHERIFGIAEFINKYGGVTVPDLPGFGGMQSFYKIGTKPTLDNMADYLAAFVKLRYRNKRITIVGFSYGFAVVTRMLQKYPEIAQKVDLLISFAGMTNKGDFRLKRRTVRVLHLLSIVLSLWPTATFVRYVIFQGPLIRLGYRLFEPIFISAKHSKIRDNTAERQKRLDFEITLWQNNDLRTWAVTSITMFKLDLAGEHIALPVHHVSISSDRYFNNLRVEQHMRNIYSDFHIYKARVPSHAPSILATAKQAGPFVPASIRRLMNKKV